MNADQFRAVMAAYVIDRRHALYLQTGNPIHAWSAYDNAHKLDVAIPDWVLDYFDASAKALTSTIRQFFCNVCVGKRMNTKIARATLNVVRKERNRRLASLPDDAPVAEGQWLSVDEPFVNELCLMLVVAIHHQVERELLSLSARVTNDGKTLNHREHQERLKVEKKCTKGEKGWRRLAQRLRLDSVPEWGSSMEILRLLANCYKHATSQRPEERLLRRLGLDQTRNYASLPESPVLREGLARSLNLDKSSDYCDIADEFVTCADRFLSTVRQQPIISAVKGGRGGSRGGGSRPSSFLC